MAFNHLSLHKYHQQLPFLAAFSLVSCLALSSVFCSPVGAADRLILQDLTIISKQTVASVDADGAKLDDGRVIGWGEIKSGRLANGQEQFNKLLAELGPPLSLIRQRLDTNDYRGLAEPAAKLYPTFVGRQSKTAYMVFQSLMWGSIATGDRAAAVAPYLRCYNALQLAKSPIKIPGERTLKYDPTTGFTDDLPPVWFDETQAKDALPTVFAAVRDMKVNRPDGAYLYYASLLIAAGMHADATNFLSAVKGESRESQEVRDIVFASSEVIRKVDDAKLANLRKNVDSYSPKTRPLALHWLGLSSLNSPEKAEKQAGMLRLLYIPALYSKSHPELAAHAIYRSMETLDELGDPKGSIALRRELQLNFPHTLHAAKLKTAAP